MPPWQQMSVPLHQIDLKIFAFLSALVFFNRYSELSLFIHILLAFMNSLHCSLECGQNSKFQLFCLFNCKRGWGCRNFCSIFLEHKRCRHIESEFADFQLMEWIHNFWLLLQRTVTLFSCLHFDKGYQNHWFFLFRFDQKVYY